MSDYECSDCGRMYEHKSSLKRHFRKKHPDRLGYECSDCGEKFNSNRGLNTHRARLHKDSAKVLKECEWCGAKYEIHPTKDQGRFCSRECWRSWASEEFSGENHPQSVDRVILTCEWCGDKYGVLQCRIEDRGSKFCSMECYGKYRSSEFTGEKNPRWNGGSPESYSGDWPKQRRKTLERDGRTCQVCGATREDIGRNPDVHHIVPYREFDSPEDANVLSNLICLCRGCHKKWEGVPLKPQPAD